MRKNKLFLSIAALMLLVQFQSGKGMIPKFPKFKIDNAKKSKKYAYTIYKDKMYKIEARNYIAKYDKSVMSVLHLMYWYAFNLPKINKSTYNSKTLKILKETI
ncbi:hypothetical protein ACFLYU_05830 [Candidatus Dependentiae bacterium]